MGASTSEILEMLINLTVILTIWHNFSKSLTQIWKTKSYAYLNHIPDLKFLKQDGQQWQPGNYYFQTEVSNDIMVPSCQISSLM